MDFESALTTRNRARIIHRADPPAALATGHRTLEEPPFVPLADHPPYQKFEVDVKRSRIDGFGVFAAQAISPRLKIGEIRGESITVAEARRRAEGQERIMIVEVSHRRAIDASRSTDPMRFTNHSCQPNARLSVREGRIEFYALKAIGIGDEITVDYGETHHEGRLACRCGAPGCTGWL